MNNIISIIIPAYNCEHTIIETLNSVKAQDYVSYEVIIIENGSNDNTFSIIKDYIINDNRFKLYYLEKANVCNARNIGFKFSSGDYITYLDADDIIHPNKLSLQLQNLHNNPNCTSSLCWTNYVDKNNNLLFKGESINYSGDLVKHLLTYSLSCGSVPLIKREVIEKIGLWDTSLLSSNDWDYWFRLSLQGEFCFVPKYLVNYRQTPNSISQNIHNKRKYIFIVIEKNFSSLPIKYKDYHKYKNITKSNCWFYLAILYHERGANYKIKSTTFICLVNTISLNSIYIINFLYWKLFFKSIIYFIKSLYEK